MSEMLYVDDLVLMSEMMEGLREKFWKWKERNGERFREQGAEGEPREDKSGSEWGRR